MSRLLIIPCIAIAVLAAAAVPQGLTTDPEPASMETTLTDRARGTFDVTVTPVANVEEPAGVRRGRSTLEKRFHGDLDATGEGEMLTALTPVAGSAAYVAIERVTGTLHGRSGSFMLQHQGVMSRGDQQLAISVVPDSGTGELIGLSGTMTISIEDGTHSYDFTYALAGE